MLPQLKLPDFSVIVWVWDPDITLLKVQSRVDDTESATLKDQRPTKKNVARNDPCPCGSGKKFKKCCLH
jgi:uncharacterized protein YecA (UPF0149 family)